MAAVLRPGSSHIAFGALASAESKTSAPSVGEHSDEVLREASYSDAEIDALRAENIIG
jgi:crotonobetainyl-CoA:carnitine CoA-transferase CaiB-like acyl-CoA transferase